MKKKNGFSRNAARGGVLERITDQCIAQAIARMDRQLADGLRGYSAASNPLGTENAQALLRTLIRVAVAQRTLLPGRLQTRLEKESSTQFADYYTELQQVCERSVELKQAAENRRAAEEEYAYLAAVLKKVQASEYEARMIPDDEALRQPRQTDLWAQLPTQT